ncbi:annexin Gh1-like [Magnolia sinica]|uniref:annexin Gh1-like n=1 Tax=Magnolia sinica TaxID=86752 RepID=UPI0026583F6E|nr:annexin Gh1-like [Magnolia sinica]
METSIQLSKKYALDCQHLHRGFSGNGATNNQKLVEILTSRNMEELKLISQTYSALYGQDLLHLLSTTQKNQLLARVAYLRMSEPHKRDAEIVRGSLSSTSSMDLNTLIEVVCTRSPSELQSIRQAYRARYGSDVEQDITRRRNGNLKEVLLAILNSSKIDGRRVDMSMAMCDAKVLYEAIESGRSIDKKTIISLMGQRSIGQLKAIFISYKQLYGPEFSKSLKRDKCGEFGKELRVIIRCIQHPEKHFAKQLRRAMGNSKAREVLMRVVITRSAIDIKGINNAFAAKTGLPLESLVRREFNSADKANGLVADFLIALLRGS